ncbi:hypothetical protein Pyn_36257 [Prunus yedoensis var. nudiflora]|uniref:Uncharacterized protein n=1 Tax=Prunus yedoensis var. nudiflora TaxID=2094558 RepID=A0A314YWI7_PRUYE|nr:hypothetical protein Pyn_36257 [Prunus yedoensis var. nudiflora]
MERTELAVENNDLPRSPPDLAVEENDDLAGIRFPPPSQEPPTDSEIGNLELLEILWKASGKLDVLLLLMSSKE